MQEESSRKRHIQWLGFFLGPLLAGLCLWCLPTEYTIGGAVAIEAAENVDSPPAEANSTASALPRSQEFSWAGRVTLAVMVWMGVWWLTEALNICLTALLPIVLFPWFGAADIKEATAPYANHLIYLYFGGFVIALAMERWGLGKRIALITLKMLGTTAPRMIAGFMLVTAVLSAFVSNTATTAMMLPIALSVVALLRSQHPSGDPVNERVEGFATCLLLAIAYSASVGGIMTIIGTPTNAFLIGFIRDSISEPYRQDFSFVGWLPIGVSLAVVFLPVIYFTLTRLLFPIAGIELRGGKQMIAAELESLGQVQRGEWNTLAVFLITVVLWLIRPLISPLEFGWQGAVVRPLAGLTDTGIAMTAALALYMLPVNVNHRTFTMDWTTTQKIPWGILLLFGGGLSLAAAVQANGVAEYLGSFAARFGSLPLVVVILLVTTAIIFLTELTSNVATTTSLVPVLAALAPGLGIHPYLLIVPATVAASCAFMLPVATPPNAIVFGTGAITSVQMVRAGFLLNVFAIFVVTLLAMLVFKPWLGV